MSQKQCLGIQNLQDTNSVAVGQHNGGSHIAADVRRVCNHMEVTEPAWHTLTQSGLTPSQKSTCLIPYYGKALQ